MTYRSIEDTAPPFPELTLDQLDCAKALEKKWDSMWATRSTGPGASSSSIDRYPTGRDDWAKSLLTILAYYERVELRHDYMILYNVSLHRPWVIEWHAGKPPFIVQINDVIPYMRLEFPGLRYSVVLPQLTKERLPDEIFWHQARVGGNMIRIRRLPLICQVLDFPMYHGGGSLSVGGECASCQRLGRPSKHFTLFEIPHRIIGMMGGTTMCYACIQAEVAVRDASGGTEGNYKNLAFYI